MYDKFKIIKPVGIFHEEEEFIRKYNFTMSECMNACGFIIDNYHFEHQINFINYFNDNITFLEENGLEKNICEEIREQLLKLSEDIIGKICEYNVSSSIIDIISNIAERKQNNKVTRILERYFITTLHFFVREELFRDESGYGIDFLIYCIVFIKEQAEKGINYKDPEQHFPLEKLKVEFLKIEKPLSIDSKFFSKINYYNEIEKFAIYCDKDGILRKKEDERLLYGEYIFVVYKNNNICVLEEIKYNKHTSFISDDVVAAGWIKVDFNTYGGKQIYNLNICGDSGHYMLNPQSAIRNFFKALINSYPDNVTKMREMYKLQLFNTVGLTRVVQVINGATEDFCNLILHGKNPSYHDLKQAEKELMSQQIAITSQPH